MPKLKQQTQMATVCKICERRISKYFLMNFLSLVIIVIQQNYMIHSSNHSLFQQTYPWNKVSFE